MLILTVLFFWGKSEEIFTQSCPNKRNSQTQKNRLSCKSIEKDVIVVFHCCVYVSALLPSSRKVFSLITLFSNAPEDELYNMQTQSLSTHFWMISALDFIVSRSSLRRHLCEFGWAQGMWFKTNANTLLTLPEIFVSVDTLYMQPSYSLRYHECAISYFYAHCTGKLLNHRFISMCLFIKFLVTIVTVTS